MENTVCISKDTFNNANELICILQDAVEAAKALTGRHDIGCEIHIDFRLDTLSLLEETQDDGSKLYNVQID